MLYMFDMEVFMTVARPEADLKVLAKFMDMWTNFAKYGNPTPEDKIPPGEIKWPLYDPESQPKHLVIDDKPGRLEAGVISEREEKFWMELPIEENIPTTLNKDEL
jgi:carboxylesterase type B